MRRVLGLWIGLVVAVIVTVAFLGQRSLIYHPDAGDPGSYTQWRGATAAEGRDVALATQDGLELTAWLLEPNATVDRDVAVLYLPGNAGHRGRRAGLAQALAAHGFTVLLMDYRGYGGNPGSPSEEGFGHDARAAAAWLRENDYAPSRTLYVGESIGTGVATTLAVSDPPAGLLLRSPYTSLAAVARDQLKVPVGPLLRDRFETLEQMPAVTALTTVLAGADDSLIPPAQSRRVAEAAPRLHAFVEVDGADHNDDRWFGDVLADHVLDLADHAVDQGASR